MVFQVLPLRTTERKQEEVKSKRSNDLEARIRAAVEAYDKEYPIKDDEIAVAVTRDGKIYRGRTVEPKIRNRYIHKLLFWIGKVWKHS